MQKKSIVVNDIDYITENEKPVIRLFGQDAETHTPIIAIDKTFKPYMYILPYDYEACIISLKEMGIENIELEEKIDIGIKREFIKIILKHPQDVPKIRDTIKNLPSVKQIREYDIPFYRRYLIDKQIKPTNIIEITGEIIDVDENEDVNSNITLFQMTQDPIDTHKAPKSMKILSFDIEVYNKEGMPTPEHDPIIMMSMTSNEGRDIVLSTKKSELSYVETCKTEEDMLYRFAEIIHKENPDILVGYNSDNFDLPYIKKRCDKLKIKLELGMDNSSIKFINRGINTAAQIKGYTHVDLYPLVRQTMNLDHYTLERVYEELFGEEKVDVEGEKIFEYWDSDDERLVELFEYSKDDAHTTVMIADKITPLPVAQTRLVGQPLFDISRMTTGQMVEWYLIDCAYEQNNIIPNKPTSTEYTERRADKSITGGYVKEPEKGLFEHIAYLDFKSLYPSIIISKNISPDTIVDDTSKYNENNYYTCPENGYKFLKQPFGFIPSIMGNILDERQKIKQKMKITTIPEDKKAYDYEQQGLKRLANSMFGAYGYTRFRWYKKECAAAITAWGREYIQDAMAKSEEYGFKPIYADTDGFYATYVEDLE
ncbi:DNA-directed DNA polymerase [uncultured Methanosphaera sp.]|uniref:DNA-directed DNA polymerase n=1 Tax=uncultured Methanosphaera sp. TaxID=262501 RepID=UPI0028051906|nr:DNA-directed DNA polymerase [uncultured Methanosphaera sp.]